MFRNMTNEAHLPGGQSPSSSTRHDVVSARLDAQESSWIGLLSVVSRPALSFLQKYVTGRPRNLTCEKGPLKGGFVDEESEFFRRLDEMVAAPRLTYLRCEHDADDGLLEPSAGGSLSWLTADSLQEMGIQSPEEGTLNRAGHFSSVRTFLSHVVLSSCQETKPTAGKDWGISKTRTWWGSFWGSEETSQKGLLSDLSWAEEETVTWQLCPQQPVPETKAAETTNVFVRGSGVESTLGENTGQGDHKDQLVNNKGLHMVQNSEGSTAGYRLSISDHLSNSESAAACSEVALLTPDQDNGYSSLEEEHIQMSRLYGMKASGGESETSVQTEMEEKKEQVDEEEGIQDEQKDYQEGQTTGTTVLSTPQCQNKAIAFIMGCPYNDDSSQSDRGSSDDDDDDDDDGFDSEGLSDLSNSSDEDDEESSDSDSEANSEAERLWSSLCQSQDPYNPRNFTAQVATSNTLPRTIPTSTPPSSTLAASPQLATSSSPPCTHDFFDDSTSASEVDEAESLRLWSSFSCSSDPYSPFNFQAPLRTRGPAEAPPRAKSRFKKATHTPSHSPHQKASSPPEHRKEETEERREHSSSSSTSRRSSPTKKVRFCDDVEEFFASCGEEEEDRRGPWEELARDRCRFLRRCQEVEQSIAYCLQPQHRSLMYRRLTVQDA